MHRSHLSALHWAQHSGTLTATWNWREHLASCNKQRAPVALVVGAAAWGPLQLAHPAAWQSYSQHGSILMLCFTLRSSGGGAMLDRINVSAAD